MGIRQLLSAMICSALCCGAFAFPRLSLASLTLSELSPRWGALVGLELSAGSWGDERLEYPQQTLISHSLQVLLGPKAGPLMSGVFYEARTDFPTSSPVIPSGIENFTQSSGIFGVGAFLETPRFTFLGAIGFLGGSSLSDTQAQVVELRNSKTDPELSFGNPIFLRVQTGMRLIGALSAQLSYRFGSYGSQKLVENIGGKITTTSTSLGSNRLNSSSLGIGLTVHY